MRELKRLLAVMITFGPLLLAVPLSVGAASVDIDQLIVSAKTAADHEAIASYYDKQATEAKDMAEEHAKQGNAYKQAPWARSAGPGYPQVYGGHCDAMARYFDSIAKEDEALAQLHRKMAAKLGGLH